MKSKGLLLLIVLSQLTCHQVIFTAPPNTTMDCSENPHFIAAFNGVSTISCLLIEGDIGTPVADGTVVQFFTTLGRIPEQGKTNDGVVRVNLQADGRSGTASVTIFSGGGTITPPSSSTPSTTAPVQRSDVSSSGASGAAGSSALMAQDSLTVDIGNVNAHLVIVSANPTRITDSRASEITATVLDNFGNPAAGVPVFFTLTDSAVIGPAPTPSPGPTATPAPPVGNDPVFEHMDSQGTPVFTDTNGQARDVLRTRYPRDGAPRSVVVMARVPVNNVSGTTTVFIN